VSLPLPVLAQTESGAAAAFEVVIIVVVFGILFGWVGKAMSTKADKTWLPRLVVWAFLAKLVGAFARYYMVNILYNSGDSFRYHDAGQIFANVWRGGAIPVSTAGGEGTAFTEVVTGFLYAIYTPTFLGGFVIFAILAFIGQLLFYSAFRPWAQEERLKPYANVVLLLPSLVFWPASIGKDALMVLFLGVAAYGASRMLRTYQFSALFLIAPGLYLASEIRPHVAALLGLSLVLALLFGKPPRKFEKHPKRAVMILFSVVGAALALAAFASTFNVSVEGGGGTQDAGAFLEDVEEQTARGGSQIGGAAVTSPAQLPGAIITVLYRPLLYEGTSGQVILSALEGTALLVFTVWKLPVMWRNKGLLREKPYLLMCFFYTGGFIIAFSAILNLGILARQRVQMLPMFLAILVALSWEKSKTKSERDRVRLERRAPRGPRAEDPADTSIPVIGLPAGETRNEPGVRPPRSRSRQAPTDSAKDQASGRRPRR
jgi:hypothetical protein